MSSVMIRTQLIDEINLIPDRKLSEIYNFIRYFRLGIEKETVKNKKDSLSYAGSWQKMSTELFDEYMSDMADRRKNAFSNRRSNEMFID
jgi:hypothetical protein